MTETPWERQAIEHAKSWMGHNGEKPASCGFCYSAQRTNDAEVSCNDASSPWPQGIIQLDWWCLQFAPRPGWKPLPPGRHGEASDDAQAPT